MAVVVGSDCSITHTTTGGPTNFSPFSFFSPTFLPLLFFSEREKENSHMRTKATESVNWRKRVFSCFSATFLLLFASLSFLLLLLKGARRSRGFFSLSIASEREGKWERELDKRFTECPWKKVQRRTKKWVVVREEKFFPSLSLPVLCWSPIFAMGITQGQTHKKRAGWKMLLLQRKGQAV